MRDDSRAIIERVRQMLRCEGDFAMVARSGLLESHQVLVAEGDPDKIEAERRKIWLMIARKNITEKEASDIAREVLQIDENSNSKVMEEAINKFEGVDMLAPFLFDTLIAKSLKEDKLFKRASLIFLARSTIQDFPEDFRGLLPELIKHDIRAATHKFSDGKTIMEFYNRHKVREIVIPIVGNSLEEISKELRAALGKISSTPLPSPPIVGAAASIAHVPERSPVTAPKPETKPSAGPKKGRSKERLPEVIESGPVLAVQQRSTTEPQLDSVPAESIFEVLKPEIPASSQGALSLELPMRSPGTEFAISDAATQEDYPQNQSEAFRRKELLAWAKEKLRDEPAEYKSIIRKLASLSEFESNEVLDLISKKSIWKEPDRRDRPVEGSALRESKATPLGALGKSRSR